MTTKLRYAYILVVLTAPVSVCEAEQINKCTGHDGKVVYQKQPCGDQQYGEQKNIDPNHNTIKIELPPPSEPPKKAEPAAAPQAPPPAERNKWYK